ncbi:MAG: hypothetical protein R3B13_29940 [Polyangiaceae bacterium]
MRKSEPTDALGILLAGLLRVEAEEAEAAPPSDLRRLESGVFRIDELGPGDRSQAQT